MKRKVNPLPKKDYFLNRLQSAIADQDQGKQIYYLNRYKQEVRLESEKLHREIAELKIKTAPKLRGPIEKKEFVFSFKSGGWNSVYAKTKRGAEKLIREEYLNSNGLPKNINSIPIPGSAHAVTPEQYQSLLRAFN